MYRKNTAGQFIVVQLILTATGAVATGLSPAARRCIDGTFAAGGGTFTEDGATGSYKYAMSQTDTNGNDISIIVTAAGAIPVCVNFVTTAADPTDSVRLGLTALPNAAANAAGGLPISIAGALDLDEMNVDIEAIQTSTAGLTFTVANQVDVNVLDWKSATAPAMTGDAFARLGAPAGASVSADVAAIKGDTGTILTDVNTGAGAIYNRLGAPAGASIAADVAAVKTDTAAVKVQTDKLAFTVANKVDANTLAVNGDTTAAANLQASTDAICRGTVGAASSTISIVTSAFAPSVGAIGQFIGRTMIFDATTATVALRGQATNITNSTNASTPTLTVTALTTAPASGDTFSIV